MTKINKAALMVAAVSALGLTTPSMAAGSIRSFKTVDTGMSTAGNIRTFKAGSIRTFKAGSIRTFKAGSIRSF
jgi:hypothetical protein